MIDLGAIENFIVDNTARAMDLLRREKKESFTIRLINELVPEKELSEEITLLPITI